MKQKIVIKLQMDCDKCRNKALKIAAQVPGVTAVSLVGDDNDCVAVTGVNVDTVCLANMLKKKFSSVIIVTVEDLIKAAEAKKKKDEEEEQKKEEEEKKRKEKEEKMKKLLCSVLCKKCHSSNCHGKCETTICSECLSINCNGKCEFITVECEGKICEGEDKGKPSSCCSNCKSSKCNGCEYPPPCPKGCTCSKCYVPVPYPQPSYYPYPYPSCYPPQRVVYYDSCPDSICSIM